MQSLTGSAGTVVNAYEYDAYGRFETVLEGVANPYTYTGREFDTESGLYYYRARYYDTQTGRFLSEDPIGFAATDLNLYRYVVNDPMNRRDPDGHFAVLIPPALYKLGELLLVLGAVALMPSVEDPTDPSSGGNGNEGGDDGFSPANDNCPVPEDDGNGDDGDDDGDDGDPCEEWLEELDRYYLQIVGAENRGEDVTLEKRQYEKSAVEFIKQCPHLEPEVARFSQTELPEDPTF